jgi:hypothetical protein
MNKPDDFDCWRLPEEGNVQKYIRTSPDHTLVNPLFAPMCSILHVTDGLSCARATG